MKDRILNAISTTTDVLKKKSSIDIIHGFTPEPKYYGYKVSVTFRSGTNPYNMGKFTELLQKCLPEYCVTEFYYEFGNKWYFEIMLKGDEEGRKEVIIMKTKNGKQKDYIDKNISLDDINRWIRECDNKMALLQLNASVSTRFKEIK